MKIAVLPQDDKSRSKPFYSLLVGLGYTQAIGPFLGGFQSSWCIATCRNQPPKSDKNFEATDLSLGFSFGLRLRLVTRKSQVWIIFLKQTLDPYTTNRTKNSHQFKILIGNLWVQGFPVGGWGAINMRGSSKSVPCCGFESQHIL